jgi:hypothetical protein
MVNYIFYQAVCPHSGSRHGVFPAGPSNANTFAWRERMKARLLGKTRSAVLLLMFVTAQAHFSALAQCAPSSPTPPRGAQHPALLASYAKRPPWNVAGVDYAVGLPSMTTLTDWQCLSGPGISVNTTHMPPYVRVDNTSNVVISGVDFSLHGGAAIFFVNSPNPTVVSSLFAGKNLHILAGAAVIYADGNSPGLTVSYNIINGAGAGSGSTLVSASGGGRTTLTYNWLKHFPQHVLELNTYAGATNPYSLVYKYNLIEKGGMQAWDHMNFQFGTNTDSTSIDVEYNTFYQTWRATGGEGYQFGTLGNARVKNVTLAYNVMIAAQTPGHAICVSYMIHADGSLNVPATAHDNYVDPTASWGWLYPGLFTGWNFYNNYNVTTGAIMHAS